MVTKGDGGNRGADIERMKKSMKERRDGERGGVRG